MRLFLASSIDKVLPLLKIKAPDVDNKVVFIANAADSHEDEPSFVTQDRHAFNELGYTLTAIDLREVTEEKLKELLAEHDIIHMCGGSVFYLMALLKKKRFDEILKNAIKDGSIVYTSSSAGSAVLAKNITSFSYDKHEVKEVENVPDGRGLGIIPFGIVCHSNSVDFIEENKKIIENMPSDPTALFFIHDNQALWIENNRFEFLEV